MKATNLQPSRQFNALLGPRARNVLALGTSLVALAGCGGETNQNNSKVKSGGNEITDTQTTTQEPAPAEKLEFDTYEEIYDRWATCIIEVNSKEGARLGDSDKCSDERDQAIEEFENRSVSQP